MANTNADSAVTERIHGATSSLLRTTRERLWSTSAEWAKQFMLRSGFMAELPKRRVRGAPLGYLPLPLAVPGQESNGAALVVAPSYRYQVDGRAHGDFADTPTERASASSSPMIWVESPGTQLLGAYTVPKEWGELRDLRPGQTVAHLPPIVRSSLVSVGAIVERGSCDDLWREGPSANLTETLATNGYVVLKRVLPSGLTDAISRHYRGLRESTRLEVDPFSGRLVEKDEPFAQHLLHQLSGFVARLAARPVVPTYCYSMWYLRGARLGIHTDNEQCEYSLSLSIDQSPYEAEPWPFCVVSRRGLRLTELRVAPSDGVLFRGRSLPHYRRRLRSGESATGILLHYKAAGGK